MLNLCVTAVKAFPWLAAALAWNASFYTKVPQVPSQKVLQAGGMSRGSLPSELIPVIVAFIGASVAADLLLFRVKKPARAYLTEHNSFLSQSTLDGYGFWSAVTNRMRDIFGVHE